MLSTAPPPLAERRPGTLLRAALWDMDGTLVDTEPYWMAAEHELVESHGGVWSKEQALQLVGNALEDSARVLQKAGVGLSVREIVTTLSGRVMERIREAVPWRPGSREMLDSLVGQGVRCALVTMSERPLASLVVEQLPRPYFEFLVTGDDVARGKPDPEAYLRAMELMRAAEPALDVDNFVAFEDSVPGVSAALASGAVTIGIPHAVPLPDFAGRYSTWESLRGKDAGSVQDVLDGHWAGIDDGGRQAPAGKVSA
ncbi:MULTISPECIES: HAD family phosphatase [Arthrobacter]|uniref:HAD family phosphatase n=2 Tax=Arthrobacter TaxID=1663 RepID=A0ABU9KGC9_9MICC|nr:HAD family phosphatase [Arthrobacter sp. YJM1]MDP5225940.1 HAD family phosphatase [Arthrobacter sp. YJM1]